MFRTSRGRHLPDPAGLGLDGIFVVNADGSGETPIQPRTGGLFPDWSPNGSRIAFSGVLHAGDRQDHLFVMRPDGRRIASSSERDGEGEVWVMDADGSHQRRLTHDPATYDAPNSWLP